MIKYIELPGEERYFDWMERLEKTRKDMMMFLEHEVEQVARRMNADRYPIDSIVKITGINRERIENLVEEEERIRNRVERQEKARRDQAMFIKHELEQRKIEIAQKLLRRNMSIDDIINVTGLTREEVENLNHD